MLRFEKGEFGLHATDFGLKTLYLVSDGDYRGAGIVGSLPQCEYEAEA
jgi:hypothetical protein